jgi:fructuronate reductase
MMVRRLCRDVLVELPDAVRRPGFDPAAIGTGIVHLGIGAFARAHLACYTQPLLREDPGWGILGVSLRRADTRDALAGQDFLYTCAEHDGADERLTVMGALTGVLVVPAAPGAVLTRLVDPAARIVTLTVTEKGYYRAGASGGLDAGDPAIRRDLAGPDTPLTVPGLLVAALRLRRAVGVPAFTVLSCDNLPENGSSTRRVVTDFADRVDPELGRFIAGQVAFPNCMVDRIVPATTDTDRARIDAALGAEDRWPVVCESFSQWVIEDRFPLGRPSWEQTGAALVSDVRPYEEMKLRLLNGSHSSIAYLGQLAGWQTVAEAIAEPSLAAHIGALMQEISTTLHLPSGVDLDAYRRALLARFAYPALRHRTAQIAMDGSQKLPQRLFAPALARLEAGQEVARIALGVAAWLRYLQGRSDDGGTLVVDDPRADALTRAARAAGASPALYDAIFVMRDVVPAALAASSVFRNEVLRALDRLAAVGVRGILAEMS